MEVSQLCSEWGPFSEEILLTKFPLHHACRDGDVERLSVLLIEAQKSVYEEDSFYGWTPVHWAAYFGKLGCLQKLMTVTRLAVDCNVVTERFHQTPAHLAAFGDHPMCLKWLIQSHANIDLQDYLGETPVHKAARSGGLDCCKLLAVNGAKLFIKNEANQTAPELAYALGKKECATYLHGVLQDQLATMQQGIYGHNTSVNTFSPVMNDITVYNGQLVPCGQQKHPLENGSGDASMICNGHRMENGSGHARVNGFHANGFGQPTGDGMEMDCDTLTNGFSGMHPKVLDVTVSEDILKNRRLVGGRKRTREADDDDVCSKKIRTEGIVPERDLQLFGGVEFSSSVFEHQHQMNLALGYDDLLISSCHGQ